ncbi:MAG: SGNH/GDSL hydrolase family protein [Deltaproteobacteria bacterium]|nr:SGNH/GDSL hydrolase family protein [Deltaproteobacteria bacterium]MCB9478721.1 SGNH/GDSL hydrolase family protein [Deltaproteobacteria bacterium]MCB9488237.1 SGNH/GDSL hydrolase family protein [Deltaproteobacteria bacterium]
MRFPSPATWPRYVFLRRRKAAFAVLAVVVFFALAEGATRLVGLGRLPEEALFTDVYDAAYRMRPNASNPWTPVEEYLNDTGFRGDLLPVERTPGAMRIVFLGDSITFGVDVPLETIFVEKLGHGLRDRDMNVETLNAGMPGTNLWQQTLLFKKELVQYRPDLVVVYTAPNVRWDLYNLRKTMAAGRLGWKFRTGLSRSHFYRWLRFQIRPPKFEELYSQHESGMTDEQRENQVITADLARDGVRVDLQQLKSLCDGIGAKLLVSGVIPRDAILDGRRQHMKPGAADWRDFYKRNNIAQIVNELADEEGIATFHPEDDFLAAPADPPLFLDDCHFTPDGHTLMAKTLEREICDRRLLPERCRKAKGAES